MSNRKVKVESVSGLEKGHPLPHVPGRRGAKSVWRPILEAAAHGDSFTGPKRHRTTVYIAAKRLGFRIVTRWEAEETLRYWILKDGKETV